MSPDHYPSTVHFTFAPAVPEDGVNDTLTLSLMAVETLYGPERVSIECDATFAEGGNKKVLITGQTEVARALARIFLGYCWREFGQAAVTVRRGEGGTPS
jgi:hypothetical protein